MEIRSVVVYDKWWGRYTQYIESNNGDANDVLTFLKYETAKSFCLHYNHHCGVKSVNSWNKLKYQQNFKDHMSNTLLRSYRNN